MYRRGLAIVLLLLSSAAWGDVPDAAWFPKAPPLSLPTGPVTRVTTVAELFAAADSIQPGGTILVADGHYRMPRYLELHTDNVTLRSASGLRDRVVLDGAGSRHGELVGISNCSGVTVSDLTIQNIKWNGFKINSNSHATRVTIRNCVIHNIWQRGVKGPAVDKRERGAFWPEDCRIQYCLFYNDRPKQYSDDPADTVDNFRGNYVGGIDAMHAKGWVISDNVFVGIHGRTGEGRGAVFLWNESQDCVVERNMIIDCDSGICLGNHYRAEETRWHDRGCIVRNNFVTRCPEVGILTAHTRRCRVIHNTIHDPASRLERLIWVLDDNDGLLVANNLLSGPDIRVTGSGEIVQQHNVAAKDLSDMFVDALAGHLRLSGQPAVDVPRNDLAPDDIAGRPRPARANPGAHEFAAPAPQASPPKPSKGDVPLPTPGEVPDWVDAMKQVHAGFQGTAGYIAQFGDSITYSMAFWSPLGWDYPDKYLGTDDGLPKIPLGSRWRDVIQGTRDKGTEHANYSGWRVGQLCEAMSRVLERERPEMALIMIGTNDISGNRVPADYGEQLDQVIQKCVDAHCVPILSTIPPRRDHEESVEQINRLIRELAGRRHIPLVDFHAEILRRKAGQAWDGTLISEDGVHPSGGETQIYTEENMQRCGYALRNWLTFLAVRQVYFHVLHPLTDDPESSPPPIPPTIETDAVQQAASPPPTATGCVYSPRVLAPGVADAYSMRTFAAYDRWKSLTGDGGPGKSTSTWWTGRPACST